MAEKAKIEQVRRDLRTLKKLSHSVDTLMGVKRRHEARIEYLKKERDGSIGEVRERLEDDINRVEKFLNSICIGELIREATEMEQKYIELINRLPMVDRTIILDGYINGTPYWKVGRAVGYTERGIQNRVQCIIETLAEQI